MFKTLRIVIVLIAAAALSACATSPYASGNKARSDALLAQQVAQAQATLAEHATPRLLFAGVAMDDRSTAFRNDVQLAEQVALAIDPDAVVFKLANPVPFQNADWPYATRENIQQVLQKLGELARPQDKVLLLLSSHGAPGVLALHAGQNALDVVAAADLEQWLQPLQKQPSLLLVSACFPGSLLETLQQPVHMVLTAAAKDRVSFGCQSQSDNTYFIKALLRQPGLLSMSIRDAMRQAKLDVATLEELQHLKPPSQPQQYYGADAQGWSRQKIQQWLALP